MLASGVHGSSLEKVIQALRVGAGAAVTKSIGLEPREGYPEPTLVDVEGGLVNAAGLPNPGAEEFAERLAQINGKGLPIFVSVFGGDEKEFERVVRILDGNDFAAYELNLSCPHVSGVGTEVGHLPEEVSRVTRVVKTATDKPVFAKLSPNTERLVEVARAAVDAGADGLTAINTVRSFPIDVEKAGPALSNGFGGLSGAAIRPIALRCVYELREQFDVPIVGCGGAATWEDAVQFFLAGANMVQFGTSTIKKFDRFNDVNLGIISYLERKGFAKLEDLVGKAHA
ncbi:MAG: dihydroorotate dehydrogenase [Nitrososphaerota archaeon]|jgi:dihydroorotate dehydrogenase (NAD+) catalytic subunit|nr:dihydroorotate dehydrogenase [Nitrososphaerota archaeon]MDG6963151.1 dihydroorotate dehydrogenase [Nitrososphaerota archaeon]MDG6969910.1 dihydroorotate dehydrogenase [Nitrososphaerota archaeon]MDG6991746.1 dihydroorotate dehydrogenase [Nitrososphaerota archaeon]MDG7002482.1 dihydroorotate dehydrogenase [Nitrososphaerota archaeon]